jgi:tetratricopeptide (TPR) repeat protein
VEAFALSKKFGHESGVATSLNNLGELYRLQGRYEDGIKKYEEALAITRKLGEEPAIAETLYKMALARQKQEEYGKALEIAREAAKLARKMGLYNSSECDELVADLEKDAAIESGAHRTP